MKKRVLITGSNGFLGQELTDLLANNKAYDVFATSQSINKNSNKQGYTFQSIDLKQTPQARELLNTIKPHVIINTAAITSVDACELDKKSCDDLNVKLVKTLAEYAKQENAYILQLSTDFVFDGINGTYQEDSPTAPLNEYGASKLASEAILEQANISYSVLRTILIYGVPKSTSRSNILTWAKNMLSEKKNINVVNDQWRSPTFIKDLAHACKLAIDRQPQGILHISGGENLSISEFIYAVADFWELDTSFITEICAKDLNQDKNRPRKTSFILDKAHRQLDYIPTPLTESFAIIKQQLNKA